jgi:hypothetical protein
MQLRNSQDYSAVAFGLVNFHNACLIPEKRRSKGDGETRDNGE